MFVPAISLSGLIGILLFAAVLYTVSLVVYRLYFSPLAKFPGPKLAAATLWYEFYYDVAPQQGQFFRKVRQMHEKYGPIVRTNPFELHIADSSFYKTFYETKSDKTAWFYNSTSVPRSGFGTLSAEVHRLRRGALNPFFSRGNIDSQTPLIKEKIEVLCRRLERLAEASVVVRADKAFENLTFDIITQLAYGRSFDIIENPERGDQFSDMFMTQQKIIHPFRLLPWLQKLVLNIPPWVMRRITSKLSCVIYLHDSVRAQVLDVLNDKSRLSTANGERKSKPTIYHQILSSDLPAHELTTERLTDEGVVLLGAGYATTARSLTVTTLHLAQRPDVVQTLRTELATVMPLPTSSPPSWSTLEALPYLTAVIKEGMRLSLAVSTRLPRVTLTPMTYRDWEIPAGSTVSMSIPDVLLDPAIFVEPLKFMPERWLGEQGRHLEKYNVIFSRGARQCLGMWIAMAEMYFTVATLASRFDFELAEGTDESHIALERDLFTPFPEPGKESVCVTVKKRAEKA